MTDPTAPDPDAPDSLRDHDHPERELGPAEVDTDVGSGEISSGATDRVDIDNEWRSPARLEDLEGEVEAINTALDGMEALLRRLLRNLPDPSAPAPAPVPTSSASGSDTEPDPRREDPRGGKPDAQPDEPGDESAEPLNMRVLVIWVRDNIAWLLERRIPQSGGSPYWCPAWWLHAEAIARFWALRLVWLDAVAQPRGPDLALYWGHVDAQLAALTAENGPFCGCGAEGHNPTSPARRLDHTEPQEEYYLEVETLTADLSTNPAPDPADDFATDEPADDDPTIPLNLAGAGVPAWAQGPAATDDPSGGGVAVDARTAFSLAGPRPEPRSGPSGTSSAHLDAPRIAARPGPAPWPPQGPRTPHGPSSPNGHRLGRSQ